MRVRLLVAATGNVQVDHGTLTQQGDDCGFDSLECNLEAFGFSTGEANAQLIPAESKPNETAALLDDANEFDGCHRKISSVKSGS
jgi:hypothetical protein